MKLFEVCCRSLHPRRGLLALALLGSVALSVMAEEVRFFALDEVKPGQKGIGLTVFEGTKIEEFQVEVIGLLENFGPKQNMVLARLTGGPLANTGVIAGMSGSPVFIDGKLLGAVAFGFPFSKETIAGITPIGEMVEATNPSPAGSAAQAPPARSATARFPASAFGPDASRLPLSREALLQAFTRPESWKNLSAAAPSTRSASSAPALTPLAIPLAFGGFDQPGFESLRSLFEGLGFAPVFAPSQRGLPPGPLPDLQPGGAVGVSLLEGDYDLSATGTITHIADGRVYAFGHPFYNLGPTQFPMKKAYVFSIFPSLYQSWKISAAERDAVGTMDQDRTTAISGSIGKLPRMIPFDMTLSTSRGQERTYSLRMVEDELFTPILAYVAAFAVLQANERSYGTQTVKLSATLSLEGRPDIKIEDIFTESNPALLASAYAAAPLAYLMANSLEPVRPTRLVVKATSFEEERSARLERVWLEQGGPIRPGSLITVKAALRDYRGQTRIESVPLQVPTTATPGPYSLLVADGPTLTMVEQRELRQQFEPRNLDQLLRALNGLRRSDRLYFRLSRADEGAVVGGEWMPSLPPSVLSVLSTSGGAEPLMRTRSAAVWDHELPLQTAVSGSRTLSIPVER